MWNRGGNKRRVVCSCHAPKQCEQSPRHSHPPASLLAGPLVNSGYLCLVKILCRLSYESEVLMLDIMSFINSCCNPNMLIMPLILLSLTVPITVPSD